MKNPDRILISPVHEALQKNLEGLLNVLEQLQEKEFSLSLPLLSGSSIGAHIRHCIEMVQCVQEGYNHGHVCYENRKRDPLLQSSVEKARQQILFLRNTLFLEDRELFLVADYSLNGSQKGTYNSSYFRELAYCLEHNIHHMALVRIGLYSLGLKPEDSGLGIAPSTIRFMNNVK